MGAMNKILVVDDDHDFRRATVELLTKAGYEALQAASGGEGMELLRREHCDLVLLDLVLPGADGMELLREILRLDDRTKVILVTAFATVENAVEGIKLGATDVLAKPFRMGEFTTLIHRTMEEVRFEREACGENLDMLLGCLSNSIRRFVVESLSMRGPQRMSDLMKALAITDHTKLGFHLKNLQENGIIERAPDRAFRLTAKGRTFWTSLRSISRKL